MLRHIQYSRAVAALLVVFFHTAGALSLSKYFGDLAEPLVRSFRFGGSAGVSFFFVLSGFIIHHVHQKDLGHPNALLPYLTKRLTRIYPTYWIIFIVIVLLAQLSPQLKATIPSDWLLLLKSLLLLPQSTETAGGTGAPVLVVAWSLQYEVLFYSVFALGILSKKLFSIVWIAWVLLVFSNLVFGPYRFPMGFFGSPHIILFILGIVASYINSSSYRLPFPGMIALVSILLFFSAGLVANRLSGPFYSLVLDWAYGLCGAAAVLALARKEKSEAPSERPRGRLSEAFTLIGDASYSLYLIHYPLISILCKLFIVILAKNQASAFISFVVIVPSCVAVAIIFHLLIERPMLRHLKPGKRFNPTSPSLRSGKVGG